MTEYLCTRHYLNDSAFNTADTQSWLLSLINHKSRISKKWVTRQGLILLIWVGSSITTSSKSSQFLSTSGGGDGGKGQDRGREFRGTTYINTITINGSIIFKSWLCCTPEIHIINQLYLKTKPKNHSNGEKENFQFKEKQLL